MDCWSLWRRYSADPQKEPDDEYRRSVQREVWIEMDVPWAHAAGPVLQERLASLNPKIIPYGGVRRRIRLTVDTPDALGAARYALEKLAMAIADWGTIGDAFVDEVVRVPPVDGGWESLAKE